MRRWIAAVSAAAVVAVLILGGGLFVQKAQAKAAEASGITAEDPQEALGGPEAAVPGDELHMMDDSNLGASPLRIVLFTSPKASDDHAVNESVRSGLAEFMESDKTVTLDELVEKTGDPEACLALVKRYAASYDVAVVCGEAFSGICEIARDLKDVRFILFDIAPVYKDGSIAALDNVTSFTYRNEECGFLAGAAAALETKSGKVAAVSTKGSIIGDNAALGFICGVNYANKHLGTSAQVLQPQNAENGIDVKEAIAGGCDIVYAAVPECAAEVLEAVKAAQGVRVIGSYTDQFPYGKRDKDNVVITSVYRTQNLDVIGELISIAFDSALGENKVQGADDFSINYYFDEDRSSLSPKSQIEMEKVYERLMTGAIEPASKTNGMTQEQFKGL